ncbi:hypothetical protein V8F20_000604 [Naviculisporaceae sp. PSN 640]
MFSCNTFTFTPVFLHIRLACASFNTSSRKLPHLLQCLLCICHPSKTGIERWDGTFSLLPHGPARHRNNDVSEIAKSNIFHPFSRFKRFRPI